MKKRILSLVIVLSMLISCVPIIAHAATSGQCGDNVYWTLDNSGTLTISGTGDMTDYGYSSNPFFKNTDIKTIIMESGVTSIGSNAFENCSGLTSVTIPYSVTKIGDCAFSHCGGLTSVSIPSSVTNIGDYAFGGCGVLTNISIPDSVTSIGRGAFSATGYDNNKSNWESGVLYIGNHLINSNSIEIDSEYIIKDTCKTIADCAFSDCRSLTSVTIPNSVASIVVVKEGRRNRIKSRFLRQYQTML